MPKFCIRRRKEACPTAVFQAVYEIQLTLEPWGTERGHKGAPSRAISTAHCPMAVAHNGDPVQLGPFPNVHGHPLYLGSDRPPLLADTKLG
ncbi:hypothetical protein HZH68_011447 [Vespula germanica]|uniref:Uncharacterized protein n=2 Tax=Vespula TaxID=7451 RepID=A0A834JS24_VESGE|nr:hypothetical protein HZH68_011447 [Vespula germanica]KAF7415545.1 hypothetical protein H0235_012137 [Vespula pensylvanica]